MKRSGLFLAFLLGVAAPGRGAVLSNLIVDQFGWRTGAAKVAVLAQPQTGQGAPSAFTPGAGFEIRRSSDNAVVFSNTVTAWSGGATHAQSGDRGWWADFSALNTPGSYYLSLPGGSNPGAQSYAFDVREDVYSPVLEASVRSYFYQRCGAAVSPANGGAWNHAACHTTTQSAARLYDGGDQGAGTARDVTGGWHDAGDYRKYVSFNFSLLWDLMTAYEWNPCAFGDATNIPESGNGVPDILDELKWEMDWLLKMQSGAGGNAGALYSGVFVTAAGSNGGDGDPSLEDTVYWYANHSSGATATGCMALAKAARLFAAYPAAYPGYAATLQAAAEDAWAWLQANPANVTYNHTGFNNANANIDAPDDFGRRLASAAELYRLTGDPAYRTYFDANYDDPAGSVNGGTHHPILNNQFMPGAALSLQQALISYAQAPGATASVVNGIRTALKNGADTWVLADQTAGTDLYRGYMWDGYYGWGSNGGKSRWGGLAVWAWKLGLGSAAEQLAYQRAGEEYLHYIHGRNPLNWCYLTNMGPEGAGAGAEQSVNEIFHGWFGDGSVYDGLGGGRIGPAPGILVGGTNQFYVTDTTNAGGTPAYPPAGQPILKSYRNWNTVWPDASWSVTENSIGYQGPYTFLAAMYAPCSGPQPTATPTPTPTDYAGTPTSTATPSPTPSATATPAPVCQALLNGAETLAENGTWGGGNAVRSIVNVGGAPAGAVTQGINALYVNVTVSAGWNDGFANLNGFAPADWSLYTQLSMDVHVDASLVAGATYTQLQLYADCATCGAGLWYQPIGANVPELVAGAQTVTWNLDFTQGSIPPGSPLSRIILIYNNNATAPTGALYIDNLRLNGACATPTRTATASVTPLPSPTATPSLTATESSTPLLSPTATPSLTATESSTPPPSPTATPSLTATESSSPSATPPSGSPTDTPTATPSPSISPTGTESPTMTVSSTVTETGTITPTFSASPTASPSPTPACPGAGFLGSSTVLGSQDLSGYIDGNRWNLPVAGTVNAIQFYVGGGSGDVRVAVYADAAGAPGALLTQAGPQTFGPGIQSLDVPPVDLVPGYYWLFVQTTPGLSLGLADSGGYEYYQAFTFGAFPPTLTGGAYYSWRIALLAVICPLPTPTVSPTASTSPTPSPTSTLGAGSPTISPTATPSLTTMGTPSSTVSRSNTPGIGSATPTATHSTSPTPSRTLGVNSPTVSLTATPSLSATRSVSPQPSATATPTLTATGSVTPQPSPTATPSLSATQTVTPQSSPTITPTLTTTSFAPGALVIDQALPWPNPGPLAALLKLQGAADGVEIRVFSVAWVAVARHQGGALLPGWNRVDLPAGWSRDLPSGLYYIQLTARRGSVVSAPVTVKAFLAR